MKIASHPFSELPFTKLFRDYANNQTDILNFFESSPFDEEFLDKRAMQLEFKGDRSQLADQLIEFNSELEAPDETLKNIEKFRDHQTLAVVTGQQLTLYGGPLFTVYKVLTAIILANKWEKKYNKKFVPVFWLADEDHDFEEIASVGIPSDEGTNELTLLSEPGDKRVSEIYLDEALNELKDKIKTELGSTDFSDDLWSMLDSCYSTDETVRTSFAKLLFSLFGKYGIVLAGSNSESIKMIVNSTIIKCIDKREEIYQQLTDTSDKLIEAGYHGQVKVQQSNLFWIDDNGKRVKLNYDSERWIAEGNGNKSWTSEELKSVAKNNPNRLSPNVFLRPVIQDTFLPTFAYVGGPGEIAYYAQMKSLYSIFDKTMPVIMPRFSATIIESGIERILEKLSFSTAEYHNRIEELETKYIQSTDSPDIEALFAEWKRKVEDITSEMKPMVAEIDPTLENTAGKASATYYTELDKLKGKIYRSLKQQEKTQLNRISKIKNNLFPNGNLQEREVAFIYFMNKYGLTVWDDIFDSFEQEMPNNHKLIYL
ncbi:MAG: bacillithiol biosynthesis cysteine-adding enzyme BshC [Balneolaceae bacterium]|nr:MAG: bacillithiol biosynthesis cysteine-adding enzyme BshC [Balneolaceae bacterium]